MTTTPLGLDPSMYGAEDALLNIADHYLKPGSYSTLRSGLLGYMTGAMARASAGGAYHRNALYLEGFLNTASLPSSIYNFAKIYNYEVSTATPSQCRVLVGFYLDEIRTTMGGETGVLTIPRGQPMYLGATPFVVAGEVQLSILEGSRVQATYNPNAMDFPLADGATYVRTYMVQQSVAGGAVRTVVYLELYAHQAVPRATVFQVVTSNALETSFYRVTLPTGEQLAEFRVSYKGPTDAAYRPLEKIFNETAAPTTNEFCFFSFTGDGQIEIYFSTLPNLFRPSFNSQLQVEFLTTQGSTGNFNFTGTPSVPFTSQRGITTVAELITQPSGGSDMETLKEVKQGILSKILQRNSIIIETDLQDYLRGAIRATSVNNSRARAWDCFTCSCARPSVRWLATSRFRLRAVR